jgi:hypothetical protein
VTGAGASVVDGSAGLAADSGGDESAIDVVGTGSAWIVVGATGFSADSAEGGAATGADGDGGT